MRRRSCWDILARRRSCAVPGLVLIAIVWVNLVTWLVHLAFSIPVLILLVSSVATVAAVIAFGLLVAVWGAHSAALVYFILVTLVLIGLQLGSEVIGGLVLASNPTQNDPILLIRNVLVLINAVSEWISPYTQLSRLMDDLLNGNVVSYLLHLGVTIAQAVVLLGRVFGFCSGKDLEGRTRPSRVLCAKERRRDLEGLDQNTREILSWMESWGLGS